METTWVEYEVIGQIETQRYRTNPTASVVQYWSEHRVPGFCRVGWNTTKSENAAMTARQVLRTGKSVVDRR
jgi:hypothetical protein